jgi:hypothetical protein
MGQLATCLRLTFAPLAKRGDLRTTSSTRRRTSFTIVSGRQSACPTLAVANGFSTSTSACVRRSHMPVKLTAALQNTVLCDPPANDCSLTSSRNHLLRTSAWMSLPTCKSSEARSPHVTAGDTFRRLVLQPGGVVAEPLGKPANSEGYGRSFEITREKGSYHVLCGTL